MVHGFKKAVLFVLQKFSTIPGSHTAILNPTSVRPPEIVPPVGVIIPEPATPAPAFPHSATGFESMVPVPNSMQPAAAPAPAPVVDMQKLSAYLQAINHMAR